MEVDAVTEMFAASEEKYVFGNQLVHPSAAPKPGAAPPGQQAHG